MEDKLLDLSKIIAYQLSKRVKLNKDEMEISKRIMVLATVLLLSLGASLTVLAASESLDNGKATWSGGENSDGILYSKLVDNKLDGIQYTVTVWVKSDDGIYKDKTGTTTGLGKKGQVKVSKAATHKHPTVAEKCGYKNFGTAN